METHLQTLARGQAAAGAKVEVVCVNHESDSRTVVEWDGTVQVTRVATQGSLRGLDLCPDLLKIFRDLCRQPPDVLHLHTPNPTMLLPVSLFRPKCALVVMHHSDIVRQRLLKYVQSPFERAVYRKADAILSTSKAYTETSELLLRFKDKTRIFPMGLDLAPYSRPGKAALEHAETYRTRYPSPLWLCAGRLVYYKGLNVAIDALREVPGQLVVVGTGPSEACLRAQAKRNGVADRILWRGKTSQDELVGAYHAATALWFPSIARSEAYGLVQVEAMASGCPVLNTSIPGSGASWVSRHEETGLTVPVGNAGALASAARKLLQDPLLRKKLAAAAVLRAEKYFDHRAMTRLCFEIYDQVLGQRSPMKLANGRLASKLTQPCNTI
jgi:rhamnosyl/mannosyltransferase